MNKKAYHTIHNQLQFTKADRYFWVHVGIDSLLVFGVAYCAQQSWAGQIGAGLLLTVLAFRSFSMMHEAVHHTAHSNRLFNGWIGHIYGAIGFLPFSQWQKIHLQHHLWAGNVDLDPTMRILKIYKETGDKPSFMQELAWRWWLPYLAFRQQLVFWQKSFEGSRAEPKQLLLLLADLAALIGFWGLAFYFTGWLAPAMAVIGYLFMVELVNFPHHLGLEQGGANAKLLPHEQYKVARSVIYHRWFNSFVLLNFNYHVEHHLFPTLPWHQLDRAHRLVREELKEKYNLSYGNEWLIDSRKMNFTQTLDVSVGTSPDRLQEAKLVA